MILGINSEPNTVPVRREHADISAETLLQMKHDGFNNICISGHVKIITKSNKRSLENPGVGRIGGARSLETERTELQRTS